MTFLKVLTTKRFSFFFFIYLNIVLKQTKVMTSKNYLCAAYPTLRTGVFSPDFFLTDDEMSSSRNLMRKWIRFRVRQTLSPQTFHTYNTKDSRSLECVARLFFVNFEYIIPSNCGV